MITRSVAHAQGRRLVDAVRHLSTKLDRPVSGRDLELHFREHPDERPNLMQAIGQQLIKTARPFQAVDRVFAIGMIGNRSYYAATDAPYWVDKLATYHAALQVGRLTKENLPNKVASLVGGPYDALARNALAGWCREINHLLPKAKDFRLIAAAMVMTQNAQPLAAPKFILNPPSDFICRYDAEWLLSDQLSRRAAYLLDVGINWYRIMGGWAWPQSILLEVPPGPLVYSRAQMYLLAASLWPEDEKEERMATALLWASRYGLG